MSHRPGVSLAARIAACSVVLAFSYSELRAQSCEAPDPADRPSPAKQYFMVIVDSSGSMTQAVSGAPPSCAGYPNNRFGHARCAVKNLVETFSDRADFGLAQFATLATNVTHPCFGDPHVSCYPQEQQTRGSCTGCGPRPGGNPVNSQGARLLLPVGSEVSDLSAHVDNSCLNPEIGPPFGNTPLNGALRDMKRYFQTGWTSPDGAVSFPSPLIGETLTCRRVNVILLTDGDETCDRDSYVIQAAQDLFQNGVTVEGVNYKVRTYVINFAGASAALTDQIAFAGGTGLAHPVNNEAQLSSAFTQILTHNPELLNGVDDDCNGCVDDGISQLSMTKTVTPATARAGDLVDYTITVANGGPTTADVQLVDFLPPTLTVTALTPPANWDCSTSTSSQIVCDNDAFVAGTSSTLALSARVAGDAPTGFSIQNIATLNAAFNAWPTVIGEASVLVVANQPPVADAGPNQSHAAGSACSMDVQLDGSGSSDPEGDPLTYVWTRPGAPDLNGVNPTVTLGPGSHDFTLTVSDDRGASDTAAVTVLVTDTIAPAIEAPADITRDSDDGVCGAVVDVGEANATDNCGTPSINRSPAGDFFPVGTTEVVWTATDDQGLTTTAIQRVTIIDSNAPNLTAPADVAIATAADATSCGVVLSDEQLGNATADDDCGGEVTITRSGVPAGHFFPVGTTTVVYTATDRAGNSARAEQIIKVTDAAPPVITAPPSRSFTTGSATGCGVVVTAAMLGSASASDNCSGVTVTNDAPAGGVFAVGTTTVTWTARDAAGNTATATQTITVTDETPPSLSLTGGSAVTLSCLAPYVEPGATAVDNCGGDLTSSINITGSVDSTTPGVYVLTYSVTDPAGNTASAQRTVTVHDDEPPVIDSASVTPAVLWPPNHKMVPVTVSVSASDLCSGTATCSIVSITSNELVNGLGDGDAAPDWQIDGATRALLRAERAGVAPGRIYTITVRCSDGTGGSTETHVKVTVPHSR